MPPPLPFVQKTALDHARPSSAEARTGDRAPLVLLLENIRSGGNVGSILRTADAFALEHVALAGYTPAPPHREILKTSLGAEESVPWSQVTDLAGEVRRYRERGYRIAALEQTSRSTPLRGAALDRRAGLVLVLGNEVRGVSAEALALVDEVFEIAQAGAKQSLNVSVAAGVAAWHLTRQWR